MVTEKPKKKKVGRPALTEEEVAKIKRHIIDTAKELFFTEGCESVSMRQIAQKTGYSLRLPYLYFKSKQDILRYIWEDFFVEVFDLCMEEAKRKRTPVNKLKAFINTYVEYWFDHPDRYQMVFFTKDPIGGPDDENYVHKFGIIGRYREMVVLIEECIKSGDFEDADPYLLSQILICHLHGYMYNLMGLTEFPWVDRKELLTKSIDVMFKGFSPKP